jgi:hypothetical protein
MRTNKRALELEQRRMITEFLRPARAFAQRQAPANRDYTADGRFRFQAELDELRAAAAGASVGKLFGGDPYRAVRELGLHVEVLPADRLERLAGIRADGRYIAARRTVQLAQGLSPKTARETLGHELAHAHGYGYDDDRLAECWGKGFLGAAR